MHSIDDDINTIAIQKMSAFETYIAIIKGYCGQVLLYVTKAFANGGLVWSNLVMLISGIFTTICALKLIKIAQKTGIYSYSQIVKLILGRNG